MKEVEISIIIPVYNEGSNLEPVIFEIQSIFDNQRAGYSYEIVLVDDGSTDATQEILKRLSKEKVKFIRLEKHTGKGYALSRGIAIASGRFVAMMDGDGQINVRYLPEMVDLIKRGAADIVLGSKYHPDAYYKPGFFRWWIGKSYNWLIQILLRYNLTDIQAGIKLFKRERLNSLLPIRADNFDFDLEFISKAIDEGVTIKEIPIKVRDRFSGKSKVNKLRVSFGLLFQILRLYFKKDRDAD